MAAGAGLTRRRFLGAAGAATGGLAVGAGGAVALGAAGDGTEREGTGRVVFEGPHQAGIVTPAQDRLHIAAFDVVSRSREDLRALLRAWTDAARALTAGRGLGEPGESGLAPPRDTGEAGGLHPSRLTITFGLGPTLFDDRFGLGAQRPAALRELPALPGDELDPRRGGGDLCVQACSDDPQVAFHAVRNLARIGRGTVVMRWSQLGFGRTSTTSRAQDTPRNLMGFKDGTNNLRAEDAAALAEHVWVGDEAPAWMRGGTYMVTRRIRMLIEVWDRTSLAEQEATFGRIKASGAPLGEAREHDAVPLDARGPDGIPRIDPRAHIRLAAPSEHGGVRILRRGYSFTDGFDPELGQLDAGLFFISFQRDAHAQFVALQERLGRSDKLNEYIKHVASGLFAVPGGVGPRGHVAQGLFEA